MSNIEYVTSFNQRLYLATGQNLLTSFITNNTLDNITVYSEGNCRFDCDRVKYRPIDNEPLLIDWLEKFAYLIPKEFGGEFTCSCPNTHAQNGHAPNCPAGGFRRRASHWFRKVVSWKLAAETFDRFVWIDSDCVINNRIPIEVINTIFLQCPIRFHYGVFRQKNKNGIETGIVFFDVNGGAYEVICNIYNMFINGDFIQFKRWDDAWLLTVVAENFGYIEKGDIYPTCVDNHPMRTGPLSRYISHNKGIHWKQHNINN